MANSTNSAHNQQSDTLGIISLVCAFIGLMPVGIVLGVVGVNEAKKKGIPPTLSRAGWILNTVFLVLLVAGFILLKAASPKLEQKFGITKSRAEIYAYQNGLEAFYNTHGYYPAKLAETGTPEKDIPYTLYTYTPKPDGCTTCTSYTLHATFYNRGTKEPLNLESAHKEP